MPGARSYVAFDLGASGGRALVGQLQERALALEEVHRFANGPVRILDHLHWDVAGLFSEVLTGLRHARALCAELGGIGVDTWGVDYGLLTASGALLGLPYAYRDRRTEGMLERALARISPEAIYAATGIQFMPDLPP